MSRQRAFIAAVLLVIPGSGFGVSLQQVTPQEPFEVFEATIQELQHAMASGQVTAAELVDAYLARIDAYDRIGPSLNSIIRLNPDARSEAEALDRERERLGPRGLLHGIPVLLKDNYDTENMPTTGGSVALAGFFPSDDAFQVKQLKEAGAIILGKTNLHELAMGITTISSLGGQTRNPYDLSRNPGGSSGGTGAAIAASFAAVGWGTDTCGSIRNPAAQNNLFGLRPTKGLSSIDGILPLCHSQDVGGPLARTATDLAIALDATIGIDSADPATTILDGVALPSFVDALDSTALTGARFGVLRRMFGEAQEDREASRVVRTALEQMKELGAEIVDIEIADLDTLLRSSSVIEYEFKFDLIDYLATNPGAPVESMQDILDQGLYHEALEQRFRMRNRVEQRDSDAYRTALARRDSVREVVMATFGEKQLDAIVYPTLRRKAARIGDPQTGSNCQLSAASELPALSMPAGFTSDGNPIGMELLGPPLSDARLLAYAFSFEQVHQPRRPPPYVPPLEGGQPPAPILYSVTAEGAVGSVSGRFSLNVTTGVLSFQVAVSGASPEAVHAVNLARTVDGHPGPIIHLLSGPGELTASGAVTLSLANSEALRKGQLYLRVFHDGGSMGGTLVTNH